MPPLAALAPVGIAPLVALLAVASLASGWRESVAAAGPYAGLFVLLALISAWSAIVGMIGAVVLIAFVFPLVAPDGAAIERIRGEPAAPASIGDPSPGQRALCRRADRRTATDRLGNGRLASALIVALLSFGAWQAWWLSMLLLGAALQARLGAGPKPLPA